MGVVNGSSISTSAEEVFVLEIPPPPGGDASFHRRKDDGGRLTGAVNDLGIGREKLALQVLTPPRRLRYLPANSPRLEKPLSSAAPALHVSASNVRCAADHIDAPNPLPQASPGRFARGKSVLRPRK
jgi:hypothetical protein